MRYLYEALFCFDDDGFCHGQIPDIECCWSSGASYEEAVGALVDILEEYLEDAALRGFAAPEPSFGHRLPEGFFSTVIALRMPDPAPAAAVSAAKAAEMLGISRPRVTVLTQKGLLSGYHEGRNLFVYLQSIYERLRYYPRPIPLEGPSDEEDRLDPLPAQASSDFGSDEYFPCEEDRLFTE